jgi:ubiquinone/menaquinone biosynthesis C-methylase UbiE
MPFIEHPEYSGGRAPRIDAMSTRPEGYVPAAGHDHLLPLYDPVLRFLLREDSFRRDVVARAALGPRARVLDVGCGTGTQALRLARAHADAEVTGIDGDAKVLAIARAKLARAGARVTLDEGLATSLPYPAARFDRVVSTLVFHHLVDADKRRAASEIRRVLAPGGMFLLVDFGPPRNLLERLGARLFAHAEHAATNLREGLRALLVDAGFARVDEEPLRSFGFAHVWAWRATAA